MDQQYNYNNEDHEYSGSDYKNDYNKYHNSDNENKDAVQVMLILMIVISCSRACFELNRYLYQTIVTNCKKKRLTCRRLNSADEEKLLNECSICLEQYIKNDKVIELSCKHTYHEKCIKEWMDTNNISNNSCPICRENII